MLTTGLHVAQLRCACVTAGIRTGTDWATGIHLRIGATMNWQEAIVKIFLIFAETTAGQPMPAERKQVVALLWCAGWHCHCCCC